MEDWADSLTSADQENLGWLVKGYIPGDGNCSYVRHSWFAGWGLTQGTPS